MSTVSRAELAHSNKRRVGTVRPALLHDLPFDVTRRDQSRRSANTEWMRPGHVTT